MSYIHHTVHLFYFKISTTITYKYNKFNLDQKSLQKNLQ